MSKELNQINKWLYPVSWIYGAGVWLRNKLFDWGYYKERSFNLPVICVGNLTVGGTGKTPHTEYLIRLLQKSYQVAVLSRGYKRKSKGFVLAQPDTPVHQIGDEPYQMKQKFPNIHMAVDADRCHGIEELCKASITPSTDVVLLDDAFQHRRLRAGFYILLTSYDNLYVNDHMLPRGRLRDLPAESARANAVVVTKCPTKMQPIDRRIISNALHLASYQQLYFSSISYSQIPIDHTPLLVAGIANPQPLLQYLQQYFPHTELLSFPDHHDFTAKDIQTILNKAEKFYCVVTTEKDYMRMQQTPLIEALAGKLHVLPIQTDLGNSQAAFDRQVRLYVSENNRKKK